jgi:trimethylamine--corrinoid protein Co-methyltransferase
MKPNRLEVLSPDEIDQIHEATLDLLEFVGVRVESPEAREVLIQAGANNDGQSQTIKFPRDLVETCLKGLPSSCSLFGPDPSFAVTIDTESMHFSNIGTPIKIYAPEKESQIRDSTLVDSIQHLRLLDKLEHTALFQSTVWPTDVEYTHVHWHLLKAWATYASKPYGLGCFSRTASEDMMQLVSFRVGGMEELIAHPRLIGFFNPTSPLLLPQLMTNGLEVFAKHNQPMIIAPCAAAGSTAPITLAGLLTQSNMEILSTIVLDQLYRPGHPVIYGSVSSPMDLSTGSVAWGAIEVGLIAAGIAQLARYYNIPSRGPGCLTDSKCFDIQNGYERFMTLLYSAQAGTNLITCSSTYESSLSAALELAVIDDDLIGMVLRAMDGIQVDAEHIAKEVIQNVAAGSEGKSNYLRERHTIKNMRKEIFASVVADRERRVKWNKAGALDIIARARARVDEILQAQPEMTLDPEVAKQFDDYFAMMQPRTMENMRRSEGLQKGASGQFPL